MKTIQLKGSKNSDIFIGEKFENIGAYIPKNTRVIIITDINIYKLHKKEFPPHQIILIGSGEKIKTLNTVNKIYKKLMKYQADRNVFLLGVGGGIVCDITGFVASTYLRGVRFGFVSTTLLSQVDASVGGKNGVNFLGYKNMIGVFNQPEFVICDINMLKTLPSKELSCGFAEIIKHALIANKEMFKYLQENFQKALNLNDTAIEYLINQSLQIKAEIVEKDETEKGERRKLNFGHTFGHAIEKNTKLKHGEAISVGMIIASELSLINGFLEQNEVLQIESLLTKYNLPTYLKYEKNKILKSLIYDKKRLENSICFILLEKIGKAVVKQINLRELEKIN